MQKSRAAIHKKTPCKCACCPLVSRNHKLKPNLHNSTYMSRNSTGHAHTCHQASTKVGAGAVLDGLDQGLDALLVGRCHPGQRKVSVHVGVVGDQCKTVTVLHCRGMNQSKHACMRYAWTPHKPPNAKLVPQ